MSSPTITDRIAALPPIVRHLVLILVAALLSWGTTDVVPGLSDEAGLGGLLAVAITAVIGYLTPLVQGYGLGDRQGILQRPAKPITIEISPQVLMASDELRTRMVTEFQRLKREGNVL